MTTRRLDLEDAYSTRFRARVTGVRREGDRVLVSTDRTAFYPEGGGQPADRGSLGEARVTHVFAHEGVVWHALEGEAPSVGEEVTGVVDFERRFDHMQQHTGQHLLSAVLRREFGLETVSFHLGRRAATIDLEGGEIGPDAMVRAEDAVREVVRAAVPVEVREGEASELEGRAVRAAADGRPIRLVVIGDIDVSPCGGTHVRSTSEIEAVRILGLERVRGRPRVHFLCGGRVARDHRERLERERRLRRRLGVPESKIESRVEALEQRAGRARRRLKEVEERLFEAEVGRLAGGRSGGPIVERTASAPGDLAPRVAALTRRPVLLVRPDGETCEAALHLPGGDAKALLGSWLEALGGRGGGRGESARGLLPASRTEELLARAREELAPRAGGGRA